jgi:DNA-binding response OmpR family regulator
VLIVEDDLDIRESLATMLTIEGFEVVTAGNGLEALVTVLSERPPNVVLLDLSMPVLDGQQLLAVLRDRGIVERIPVIVVSALSSRYTPGSVANLPKPINFDTLLELVHQHCRSPRSG